MKTILEIIGGIISLTLIIAFPWIIVIFTIIWILDKIIKPYKPIQDTEILNNW